jgi:Na+/glutamate symporter
MENFWDFSVWGSFNLVALLLVSLIVANILKKLIKPLENSLIPTSVLGGILLLIASTIYKAVTGESMYNTPFFGGNGGTALEILTYHTLALGFIATALKSTGGKMTKKRSAEIFNTGVTTVSTYLIQGVFGLAITIVAALIVEDFFPAAGILLPFGYGQGTGQALNYGNIYETDYGFVGGRSFGLSIAALGFLSASIGGVIHLNILRRKKKLSIGSAKEKAVSLSEVQSEGDIPMNKGIDKITVQIALIALAYILSYLVMLGLGELLPGMRSVIYGFNFFIGVLMATLVKLVLNFFNKKQIVKKKYTNNFLLTRIGNFFFDVMIVAGIAAIQLDALADYWLVILILGIVGLIITYIYNLIVARVLFKDYAEEQFLAMYGMLTGTASTGIILLREYDPEFTTPAADNLVYQNFPAIVFGFPMMLLATFAPKQPFWTMIILIGFFIAMNVILFRNQIFGGLRARRKGVADTGTAEEKSAAGEGSDETSAE